MIKMEINLNNQFYERAPIERAIIDFKEICSIRIKDSFFTLELNPNGNSKIDDLEKEFANYVLALMRNNNEG